jgi:amino acid transporter
LLCSAINFLAVRGYGEAEFWLSGGKVILIFILFFFTFVTMVGGNPQGDAYGFRYWNDPGPFAEYRSTGSLGRFEGFLAGLWAASFAIVGPEYISMVAAEAKRPSVYIKTAFKTVYIRFGVFFIGSALAVGIILPYNDETLVGINSGSEGGGGTAAASPYVIAMSNMGVDVLPHIINFLMFTSIFSAGNTYTYCATRTLYGLALEGRAPALLRYCNKRGVPVFAFLVVMLFPFLSFLQVGNSSAVVIGWLVSIMTAGGLINYIVICLTYLNFYKATKVQGFDRKSMPYTGFFQPYGTYIALIYLSLIAFFYGYASFGPWDVETFFRNYSMQIVAPILFIFWKFYKKTKWVKPAEMDLVWQRPMVDRYENSLVGPASGFWEEMGWLVGIKRKNKNRANVEAAA